MHIFIVINPFICPYETSSEMLNDLMKFDSGSFACVIVRWWILCFTKIR